MLVCCGFLPQGYPKPFLSVERPSHVCTSVLRSTSKGFCFFCRLGTGEQFTGGCPGEQGVWRVGACKCLCACVPMFVCQTRAGATTHHPLLHNRAKSLLCGVSHKKYMHRPDGSLRFPSINPSSFLPLDAVVMFLVRDVATGVLQRADRCCHRICI